MKPVIFLFIVFLLAACKAKERKVTGQEGKPLPAFNLQLIDSVTYFNTGSIPAGKPIVLVFFSPECPHCRAQMREIVKEIDLLKGIQFYVFTPVTFEETKQFYEEYQLNRYPNIVTGLDFKNFFPPYFKVKGLPYMALYGRDKRLKEVYMGRMKASEIKAIVEN